MLSQSISSRPRSNPQQSSWQESISTAPGDPRIQESTIAGSPLLSTSAIAANNSLLAKDLSRWVFEGLTAEGFSSTSAGLGIKIARNGASPFHPAAGAPEFVDISLNGTRCKSIRATKTIYNQFHGIMAQTPEAI